MPQSKKLIKRGMLIIYRRDIDKWTFKEIGERLKISPERARQCYYIAKVRLAYLNRGPA